jgi:SRSO17 transposase
MNSFNSQKIAIVYPSKVIGKYAIDTTNSVISYLIAKDKNFKIKTYDTLTENEDDIKRVFNQIQKDNIKKLIVLFTHDGVKHIGNIRNIFQYSIYLPFIHKSEISLNFNNIIYGSIDYRKQLEQLPINENEKIVNLYDNSALGRRLSNYSEKVFTNIIYSKQIDDNNGNYANLLKQNASKLNNSILLLNMPIVKSSIILSQLRANNINLKMVYSTQINYTPLILSLTQKEDRKNMIIASSIGNIPINLNQNNQLLENNIEYNWVNNSVLIGAEYFFYGSINSFNNIKIESNQVKYPIRLYKVQDFSILPFN